VALGQSLLSTIDSFLAVEKCNICCHSGFKHWDLEIIYSVTLHGTCHYSYLQHSIRGGGTFSEAVRLSGGSRIWWLGGAGGGHL